MSEPIRVVPSTTTRWSAPASASSSRPRLVDEPDHRHDEARRRLDDLTDRELEVARHRPRPVQW